MHVLRVYIGRITQTQNRQAADAMPSAKAKLNVPMVELRITMMNVNTMLNTHPEQIRMDMNVISECIEACFECAFTCTSCADACLNEVSSENLTQCIRLNLDCSDICAATGRVVGRLTHPHLSVISMQLQACAKACQVCAHECNKHAHHHEHCRICAEACQRCENACQSLVESLALNA